MCKSMYKLQVVLSFLCIAGLSNSAAGQMPAPDNPDSANKHTPIVIYSHGLSDLEKNKLERIIMREMGREVRFSKNRPKPDYPMMPPPDRPAPPPDRPMVPPDSP